MASHDLLFAPSLLEQRHRFAPVYALVEQAIADGVFPGCAFGVLEHDRVSGDRVALLDGQGAQTYDATAPKISAHTIYDLASVTKVVVTTAMAMLLNQRQILQLDIPIVDLLPGFLNNEPDRAQVTLRHLLAHNSGLAGYARLFEQYATPAALFAACLRMPLETSPGSRVEYSDIGFILLGRALEVLAGETLENYSRREIFAPLGMASCNFNPPMAGKASIPPAEEDLAFRHRVIQGEVQDENCFVLGGVSGHAGVFGNALDLLRFSLAILSGHLFDPATIELFATRVGLPVKSSRALGWDTPSQPSSSGVHFSSQSIGHLGYSGTSLWIDRAAGCAVVLLSNRTWPNRKNEKIRAFRPLFHDAVRKSLLLARFTP